MSEVFYTTGALKDKKDRRDLRLSGITAPVADMPSSFVLKDTFPSKNQLSRGSCTSQAQGHHKERQEKRKSSARFVMALTKEYEGNNKWGAYTRNTFKIVNKYGICNETLYPEPDNSMSWEQYIDTSLIPQKCYDDAEKHKSKSYWRVDPNIFAIKEAIYSNRDKEMSVVISMHWYSEFNRPFDGLLPTTFSDYVGGHAVEVKGFDDNMVCPDGSFGALIIKNSWGESWGKNGDFYLPYQIFAKVFMDAWISLDIQEELPVDNFYGEKRTWASYLRERSFGFNPWLYSKIKRLPNNREISGLAYGYWDFETVFNGKHGDLWLNMTKPEAIKRGLI